MIIDLSTKQVDTLLSLDGNHRADWFANVAGRIIGELCDLIEDAAAPKDDETERLAEF